MEWRWGRQALRVGAAAVLVVAACGGDGNGDGGEDGASGDGDERGAAGLEAAGRDAGAILLVEPDGTVVAVSPDGDDRRTVEGAPSMADGVQGVFPLGVPGTALTSDADGALYLVQASEGRAVDLGVTMPSGEPAVLGPAVARGGGDRVAVATSVQGGDPVLVDAGAATATPVADLLGLEDEEPLYQNVVAPDERHLAVSGRDGAYLVATGEPAALGRVGDQLGPFTPDGEALLVTRSGDGGGELVRVPVDAADDPEAGEVVATGGPLRAVAAFADTALALGPDGLVLVGDGEPVPVDLPGEPEGGVFPGPDAALVSFAGDGPGDAGDAGPRWALVDASGRVEALPELDGLRPVGAGPGTVVLAADRGDDGSVPLTSVAVARVEDGDLEVAVATLDAPEDATSFGPLVPSPDGRQVAGSWFAAGGYETFVVDVAGGGDLRRVEGGLVAWSPASDDVLVGRTGPPDDPTPAAVVVAPDGTETTVGESRPLAWTTG